MVYTYETKGVCSSAIDISVDDESGAICEIRFKGGCNGNAKGVGALVKGRNAKEVVSLLEGIVCSGKTTSCPDQLACALRQMLKHNTTDE